MTIDRDVLRDAARQGVISSAQAEALWARLSGARVGQASPAPAATWRSLAAALLLAALCGLSTAAALHAFGAVGLALTSAAIAVALIAAGWQRFRRTGGERGQVLLSAGLLLPALTAFGLARAFHPGAAPAGPEGDLVDWITGPWFPVQLTTALGCGLGLAFFRIPFLAWPLATAAWFATQDAAPLVLGPVPTWGDRVLVSALTGLCTLAAGLAVDRRTRGDLAFWLYLPGLFALCGGLVTWRDADTGAVLLTLALHLGLIVASLLLARRIFAVAGALGAAAAVGHLLDDQLDGAPLVLALAVLGVVSLALGAAYHLHAPRLAAALERQLPGPVRRLLPPAGPARP